MVAEDSNGSNGSRIALNVSFATMLPCYLATIASEVAQNV